MHVPRSLAPAALLFSAACASAMPQAPSPAAPASPAQMTSLSAPDDDLDIAERDLDRALAAPAGGEAEDARTKKESASDEAAPRGGRDDRGGGGSCALACRALGSMRRATEHICAMGGDGEARCSAARHRVEGAEGRVMTACPGCAP